MPAAPSARRSGSSVASARRSALCRVRRPHLAPCAGLDALDVGRGADRPPALQPVGRAGDAAPGGGGGGGAADETERAQRSAALEPTLFRAGAGVAGGGLLVASADERRWARSAAPRCVCCRASAGGWAPHPSRRPRCWPSRCRIVPPPPRAQYTPHMRCYTPHDISTALRATSCGWCVFICVQSTNKMLSNGSIHTSSADASDRGVSRWQSRKFAIGGSLYYFVLTLQMPAELAVGHRAGTELYVLRRPQSSGSRTCTISRVGGRSI